MRWLDGVSSFLLLVAMAANLLAMQDVQYSHTLCGRLSTSANIMTILYGHDPVLIRVPHVKGSCMFMLALVSGSRRLSCG